MARAARRAGVDAAWQRSGFGDLRADRDAPD